jgi:iron complex transport system substrate-binding protein
VEAGTTLPALRVAAGGNGQFTRQIQEEVAFLGRIFGREARARACIAWLDATRARLARDRPRQAVRVYFGFGPDHLTTFGSGTFMQEWIEAAGCRNAAEGIRTAGGKEGGLAQISPEQLLAWAPDLLVLDEGDPAALARDSRWATLPAVRKGAVHRLPAGVFLWNRASFESACLLPLWLASRAGGGIDMKAEASRFYAEMFGFHLGEARLDNLLDPH